MATGTDLSLQNCRANAAAFQNALVHTYRALYRQYQGQVLVRGHILAIAPIGPLEEEGVHAVSFSQILYGPESSKEFPWVIEGLVRSAMMLDTWSGTFVEPHDTVRTLYLPETLDPIEQVIVIKPFHLGQALSVVLA